MYLKVFDEQAKIYKALAHPKRLEIVNLLGSEWLKVTEIYSMLDLPQANISQHLKLLRQAGVVETKREGKEIYYRVKTCLGVCQKALSLKRLTPLAHDPVCQMQVSTKTAGFKTKYKEKTYYFCASGCLKKFKQKPNVYVKN